MKWTQWIQEGPADGMKRQHKFSRTIKGWTATAKSTGVIPGIDQHDELEDFEGLGIDDLNAIRFEQASAGTPATAQQEADDEAEAWSKTWGGGQHMEELKWPTDMGDDLPAILVEELLEAAQSFPAETGLGWDQWHPRVIVRLSYSTLLLLVAILMECERAGEWPDGGSHGAHCFTAQNRWWLPAHRAASHTDAAVDEGQAEGSEKMGRAR